MYCDATRNNLKSSTAVLICNNNNNYKDLLQGLPIISVPVPVPVLYPPIKEGNTVQLFTKQYYIDQYQ
jgi:hypothetical protein